MPSIFYFTDPSSGREFGKWPGISKRKKVFKDGAWRSVSRKEGQMQLGLVIDKENLIFYKGNEGFYQFNPEDQSRRDIDPALLSRYVEKTDARKREKPVIIQFGGSYFLDCLIKGIGYTQVLDSIRYQNPDRLYAMLQYYLLSTGAACEAETWYEFNYTKFLYPKANLASQRISEFFEIIGRDENRRRFLMQHIRYLLKSTDEELCILVDSTGMPNKCRIPYTRVSNHDGDINIEFRVIVVVQRSTGLPVYYEMIPGNVVDASTISNIMEKLRQYGYKVQYALGDAAYSCPANMERLVLAGVDFMTRLNPAYDTFSKAYEEHFEELSDPKLKVMYGGRIVSVRKIPSVIARDKEGKEITGYVYLCRDHNAWHSKSTNLMNSKRFRSMTPERIEAELEKYGVFALVSTKDLKETEVLGEYYMRQGIEQFFDYAKNYADYLPVRKHNTETVKGHLLMGFIAAFLLVLIKNRLNILDNSYVVVPSSLKDELDDIPYAEIDTQQGTELMIRQEKQMEIFKGSPGKLFAELQFQMADVFETEIVPAIQVAGATQFYKSYNIGVPEYVSLEAGKLPVPKYRDGEGNLCTRRLAFARKSSLTREQLEERSRKGELKKLQALADKHGVTILHPDTDSGNAPGKTENPVCFSKSPAEGTAPEEKKRKKGRPPGSKNKKTLEREARAASEDRQKQPEKRKPGRPPGSKNKKTLARLAWESTAAKQRPQKNTQK